MPIDFLTFFNPLWGDFEEFVLRMSLEFSTLRIKILDGLSVVSMFKNVVTPRICLSSKDLC